MDQQHGIRCLHRLFAGSVRSTQKRTGFCSWLRCI